MTRQQADKIENKINDFILALLDEINYPNQHPTGTHKEFDKVCQKTSRKRRELTKLIEELINND